jgi:hypothetical protein
MYINLTILEMVSAMWKKVSIITGMTSIVENTYINHPVASTHS